MLKNGSICPNRIGSDYNPKPSCKTDRLIDQPIDASINQTIGPDKRRVLLT